MLPRLIDIHIISLNYLFLSVSTSSQPQFSANPYTATSFRPQATFITGLKGTSKKLVAFFQALECAFPINLNPIMAAFIFFILYLPFIKTTDEYPSRSAFYENRF